MLIFLLATFIVPFGALLIRAVENPEVAGTLSRTVAALDNWDKTSSPPDAAYAALALSLIHI